MIWLALGAKGRWRCRQSSHDRNAGLSPAHYRCAAPRQSAKSSGAGIRKSEIARHLQIGLSPARELPVMTLNTHY